jgi:creatinine amidohydrolase
MNNVCYELMRPAQVVARRKACPLAYLPVGGIEWHGPQNPLGLDGLQVHEAAVRAAHRGGGLVFPVPWYGEHRELHLAEANEPVRDEIAQAMELPPENFRRGCMGGRTLMQQSRFYQELLDHIYHQIRSLGFEAIFVLVGHGPLREYVALTTMVFERATGVKMDFAGLTDLVEGVPVDHGARTETATMMTLRPDLVDLSQLPEGNAHLIGISGKDPRTGAGELGEAFVPAAIDELVTRAAALLKRPASSGAMNVRPG